MAETPKQGQGGKGGSSQADPKQEVGPRESQKNLDSSGRPVSKELKTNKEDGLEKR